MKEFIYPHEWKPWENLELLKSAYYEPEIKEEKEKYDYSVAAKDGSVVMRSDEPGMLWGRRIWNRDDK